MAENHFICVLFNLKKHMIVVQGELNFKSFVLSGKIHFLIIYVLTKIKNAYFFYSSE